jgi:large subunit ribosomal protein L17
MRHGNRVKKLGRTRRHRRALLRNLVAALFTAERIRTTISKAKEARRFAERMITIARADTVAARRQVAQFIADHRLVKRLFLEIAPRFKDRPGGYTRILKLGPRPGDGAEMVLLELVIKGAEKPAAKPTKKPKPAKEVKKKEAKEKRGKTKKPEKE